MRLVPVTPGASAASWVKARPAIGRLVTESVEIVKDRSAELDCTIGASALTSTTSVVRPTSITSDPTERRSPGLTCSPARLSVLNEGIEISMV